MGFWPILIFTYSLGWLIRSVLNQLTPRRTTSLRLPRETTCVGRHTNEICVQFYRMLFEHQQAKSLHALSKYTLRGSFRVTKSQFNGDKQLKKSHRVSYTCFDTGISWVINLIFLSNYFKNWQKLRHLQQAQWRHFERVPQSTTCCLKGTKTSCCWVSSSKHSRMSRDCQEEFRWLQLRLHRGYGHQVLLDLQEVWTQ